MENAQSNLAGLGTKPIELNIGGIIQNQMNFMAERLEKKELAKQQARVERAKRIGDLSNLHIVKQETTNPYYNNQLQKVTEKAIIEHQNITRRLKNEEITDEEASRLYQLNEAIPKQAKSITDSFTTKLTTLMNNEGDEVLNAEAKQYVEDVIGKGVYALDVVPGKGLVMVTRDEDGEEVTRPAEEMLSYVNQGLKVYKDKVDDNKWLDNKAEAVRTIKTDNGYVTYEGVKFADSRPSILKNIKSEAPTYDDMLQNPEMRKLWIKSGRKLKAPEGEEDYDKFIGELTDMVGLRFKESDSTKTDPTMRGRIEGIEYDNNNKRLTAKQKILAIKKAEDELNKTPDNYPTVITGLKIPAKTIIDPKTKQKKTIKGETINGVAFNSIKGKEQEITGADGVKSTVGSIIIGKNGKWYAQRTEIGNKDENGLPIQTIDEIPTIAMKDNFAKGFEFRDINEMQRVAEKKHGGFSKPNTVSSAVQKAVKTVQGAVTSGAKKLGSSFAGNTSGGKTTTSTNKSKKASKGLADNL